jgi:hypothetical protein
LFFAGAAAARSSDLPHYKVRLQVTPAAGRLSADVDIIIPAALTTAETAFLLGGTYKISSLQAIGARSELSLLKLPWGDRQKIVLRADAPGRKPVRLRMRYAGPVNPTGDPPLNMISPQLVELNLDSLWAPTKDNFSTRYTAEVEIRGLPRDMVVVAPGQVRRRGDRVLINRSIAHPDIAFAAMPGLQRVAEGGFEFYAADPSSEQSLVFRRHGSAVIKHMEALFGPMPHRPARVVVVRRPRKSGYARPGYILLTEGPKGAPEAQAHFVAHEFAHTWWNSGDSTTEHRWLSESLAEYSALRYSEAAFGPARLESLLAQKHKVAETAKPMLGGGPRSDVELYAKGPLLLVELERRIGRGKMDEVLRRLAGDPPADTSEFMRVLTEVAGAEAAQAFDKAMRT